MATGGTEHEQIGPIQLKNLVYYHDYFVPYQEAALAAKCGVPFTHAPEDQNKDDLAARRVVNSLERIRATIKQLIAMTTQQRNMVSQLVVLDDRTAQPDHELTQKLQALYVNTPDFVYQLLIDAATVDLSYPSLPPAYIPSPKGLQAVYMGLPKAAATLEEVWIGDKTKGYKATNDYLVAQSHIFILLMLEQINAHAVLNNLLLHVPLARQREIIPNLDDRYSSQLTIQRSQELAEGMCRQVKAFMFPVENIPDQIAQLIHPLLEARLDPYISPGESFIILQEIQRLITAFNITPRE